MALVESSFIMNMESEKLQMESSCSMNMESKKKKLFNDFISCVFKVKFKVQEFFFTNVFNFVFPSIVFVCFIPVLNLILLSTFTHMQFTLCSLAYINYSSTVYLPKPYGQIILELIMRCLIVIFLIIHYGC